MKTKLFNIYCNGVVIAYNIQMSLAKAMVNSKRKEPQYRGLKWEIKYNGTSK